MNRLTQQELDHFEREGYLLLRRLLDVERDIRPVSEEYAGVLDRLVHQLLEAGEIESLYEDSSFSDRMIALSAALQCVPSKSGVSAVKHAFSSKGSTSARPSRLQIR